MRDCRTGPGRYNNGVISDWIDLRDPSLIT
jgi:hypothetical protein